MQNSYPIFESGQVLMSKHLNNLASYLAEQDQLTRSKLIGIGVVCGLEVDYPSDGNLLRISAGVAVTSEGHLIVQDKCSLSHHRLYTLPTPEFEEVPEDLSLHEEVQYPFFLDGNGNQIQLWELFAEDYIPNPGEPDLIPVSKQFLNDKIVMLFLECVQSSLKSCELNDCSDKGARLTFTVRKLLVSKTHARAILDMEEEIAGRPVDRNTHPKYSLQQLYIEKINPAGNNLRTFEDLSDRVLDILATEGPLIAKALQEGYLAYNYLLSDIYPENAFPGGPFSDTEFLLKGLDNLSQNIFLVQYIYDLLYDLIQSHNEFLAVACKLEAECCPNPERFPRHVLLGPVEDQPTAFEPPKRGSAFDPLKLDSGFGASTRPAPYRHHFIFSVLFDRHHERLHRVRSLHYRTFLLPYRYHIDDLLKRDIRIIPSRDGDAGLSEKSIPFYYAFKENDDLHRNWSFGRTIKNWLEQVYAHQFTSNANHPLLLKLEDQNFYRIEGIVGKSLGNVMRQLLTQKKELGLSFAVEPVYLGLSVKDDHSSVTLDKQTQQRLQRALFKLLLCRFRDLDVIFLILMMTLFFFLYVIISRLAALGARSVATLPKRAVLSRTTRSTAGATTAADSVILRPELLKAKIAVDKTRADTLLFEIRQKTYTKGQVTKKVRPQKGDEESIGAAYEKIIKSGAGEENLFDRTLKYAKTLNIDAKAEDIANNLYPTISIIDKSEQLMRDVSSASIAELDMQTFQEKYDAFEVAYDEYLSHAATTDTKNNTEIAASQNMLAINQGQLEAGGSVTLINSMLKEFQARLKKIFGELILEGYEKRHPGMEHKCGVPKGGTLILLHTHQNLIRQVLGDNQNRINEKLTAMYEKLGKKNRARKVRDPLKALAQAPAGTDPLDDFVVLADFCIPYLCCDTDCSDIVFEKTPGNIVRNGIVAGRVFGTRAGRGAAAPAALKNAVISVINSETKEAVAVESIGEAFSFSAPAGVYRIEVKKRGHVTSERLIRVPEGGEILENFVLDRPGS